MSATETCSTWGTPSRTTYRLFSLSLSLLQYAAPFNILAFSKTLFIFYDENSIASTGIRDIIILGVRHFSPTIREISVPSTIRDLSGFVEEVRLDSSSAVLLDLLEVNSRELIQALFDAGMTSPQYTLITFLTDYNTLLQYSTQMRGHTAWLQFAPAMVLESAELPFFESVVSRYVYPPDLSLTTFAGLELWAAAVRSVKNFTVDAYRKGTYGASKPYDLITGSYLFFSNSNVINLFPVFIQFEADRVVLLYQSLYIFDAKIYTLEDALYYCDWTVEDTNEKLEVKKQYRVMIMTSNSSPYAAIDDSVGKAFLAIIEYLNLNNQPDFSMIPLVRMANTPEERIRVVEEYLQSDCYILFACNDAECLNTILPTMAGTDRMVITTAYYEGERCDEHFAYTGMVPNQYLSYSMNYAVSHMLGSTLLFIGMEGHYSNALYTMIYERYQRILNIPTPVYQPVAKEAFETMEVVQMMTPLVDERTGAAGGIIVTTLNPLLLASFMKIFHLRGYNSSNYHIFPLNLDQKDIERNLDPALRQPIYLVSGYFRESDDLLSILLYHFSGMEETSGRLDSTYMALIVWSFCAINKPNRDSPYLRWCLASYRFIMPSNRMYTFDASLNVRHWPALARYLPDGKVSILKKSSVVYDAVVWSFFLPESRGFTCIVEPPPTINKSPFNVVSLLVLIHTRLSYYQGYFEAFDIATSNLALLQTARYKIDLVFEDIGSTEEGCVTNLQRSLGSVAAVFTTALQGCQRKVLQKFVETKTLLFNIGIDVGNICNRYYFSSYPDITQFRPVMQYYSQLAQEFAIIAPEALSLVMKQMLTDAASHVRYSYDLDAQTVASASTITIVLSEVRQALPQGGVLFFYGLNEVHKSLSATMTSMQFPSNIRFVSLTTSSLVALDTTLRPFTAVSSYFYGLKTAANDAFRKGFMDEFASSSTPTPEVAMVYHTLMLYLSSVSAVDSFDGEKVSTQLEQQSMVSPSGVARFESNHMMDNYFIYGELATDVEGSFRIVQQNPRFARPNSYPMVISDVFLYCDLLSPFPNNNKLEKKVTYIGFALSLTGADSATERALFFAGIMGISAVNDLHGIQGMYVQPLALDCESNVTLCLSHVRSLLENAKVVIVIVGTRRDLVQGIADQFPDPPKIIYSFSYYSIGHCSHSQLHYFVSQSQLARAAYYLAINLGESYYIVHGDDESSGSADILQSLFVQIRANLHGKSQFTDSSTIMTEIMVNVPPGSIILNLLRGPNAVDFMNRFCLKYTSTDYTMILVYMLLGEVNAVQKENHKCLEGHYRLATFTVELGDPNSSEMPVNTMVPDMLEYYHNIFGQSAGTRLEPIYEAVYDALMNFGEASRATSSLAIEALRSTMIDRFYSTPSGVIQISSDYYLTRPVYALQFVGGATRVTSQSMTDLRTEIFIPFEESTLGQECVLDSSYHLRLATYPVIKVAFYHEWYTQFTRLEIMKALVEENYIRTLNRQKLIANYSIVPVIVFRSMENFDLLITSKHMAEDPTVIASFGCATPDCRAQTADGYAMINRLFFFTGPSEGEMCNPYILNVGTVANQRLSVGVDYMIRSGLTKFLIVGGSSKFMITMMGKTRRYIQSKGLEVIGECSVPIYTDFEGFSSCFRSATTGILNVERFALLSYYRAFDFLKFTEHISELVSFDYVRLVFFYYAGDILSVEQRRSLIGSLIVTTYQKEIVSSEQELFQRTIVAETAPGLPITEEMEFIYTALEIWSQTYLNAYQKNNSQLPNEEYIRLSLLGSSITSPSGTVEVRSSFYVTRCVFVLQVTDENTVNQLYPNPGSLFLVEPQPFENGTDSECQFGRKRSLAAYGSMVDDVLYYTATVAAVTLLILSLIVYFRDSKVIKISTPVFSVLEQMCLLLLASVGVTLCFTPSGRAWICAYRVFVTAVPSTLFFSISIMKSWRIDKLFNNKQLKKVVITTMSLFRTVGLALLAELLFLTVWWLVSPSEYRETLNLSASDFYTDSYTPECSMSLPFLMIQVVCSAGFLLWGLTLAWRIRNTSSEFNESTSLASSILLTLFFGAILLALEFLLSSDPSLLAVLRAVLLSSSVLLITLIQFGGKLFRVIRSEFTRNSSSLAGSKSSSGSASVSSHGGNSSRSLNTQQNAGNNDPQYKRRQQAQTSKFHLNPVLRLPADVFAAAYRLNNMKNRLFGFSQNSRRKSTRMRN